MLVPILKAVLVLGTMSFVFGIFVGFFSYFFAVEDDSRKNEIIDLLPGANCAACGYAGCADYAEAIVKGTAAVNLCPIGGRQASRKISAVMGVEHTEIIEKTANVRCSGYNDYATHKYIYHGINDCAAAAKLLDGYMACKYGCLGFGNCVNVCPNNAISVKNGVAEIDEDICVGCGICIKECPKSVIDIFPKNSGFIIKCSNHEIGPHTKKACTAGCISCKLCEKVCEHDAIKVVDHLAVVDYEKCVQCGKCIDNCPSKIIRARTR